MLLDKLKTLRAKGYAVFDGYLGLLGVGLGIEVKCYVRRGLVVVGYLRNAVDEKTKGLGEKGAERRMVMENKCRRLYVTAYLKESIFRRIFLVRCSTHPSPLNKR